MRIWLDDLRDPKDPYIQYRYGAEPDMVWIKDGMDLLDMLGLSVVDRAMSTKPIPPVADIDFISFDHDLGHHKCDGYIIAACIEAAAASGKIRKPIAWAVHSDNPVGAARIRVALENADKFWSRVG